MKNKIKKFDGSKYMKEIKVVGKVSYIEYKSYLSEKSHDDIKSINIELKIKKNKVEKVNSL